MSKVITDFDILIDYSKSIKDTLLYISEDSTFIINEK